MSDRFVKEKPGKQVEKVDPYLANSKMMKIRRENKTRIVYIHATGYHYYHSEYAKSVGADFMPIDKYLAYYFDEKQSRLKRYLSWMLLFLKFPYRKYDAILTDEPQVTSLVLKYLSFGRLKLIATQGSTTPVYYFQNKLPKFSGKVFKYATNSYDLIICTGDVQYDLVKKICAGNKKIVIQYNFNGIDAESFEKLQALPYKAAADNILSVSTLSNDTIMHIKGTDIMVKVASEVIKKYPWLHYYCVGTHRPGDLKKLRENSGGTEWRNIDFKGRVPDLAEYFGNTLAVLQLSRMDAFPIAVIESFCAGVPVFITHMVGTKEMYRDFDNKEDYIIDVDDFEGMVTKVEKFVSLTKERKEIESAKFRAASAKFTAEQSLDSYRQIVNNFFDTHK